jgi:hypothetical protein|tara:strand:+ start:471 stop:662 length:192 start_codon:yes stop_codon:yes gene_type:complete
MIPDAHLFSQKPAHHPRSNSDQSARMTMAGGFVEQTAHEDSSHDSSVITCGHEQLDAEEIQNL